MRYSEIWYFTN